MAGACRPVGGGSVRGRAAVQARNVRAFATPEPDEVSLRVTCFPRESKL